jgi:3-hydroxyisobutyrate dehydrogenase-like beta-hydroxyacid dehydrogenase
MSTVGVVGLGAMGGRIAGRLLDAGHEVHGTNRTAGRARQLIERGLVWHDTPREIAAAVDVVISMVTDDSALEAITGGPQGIIEGLSPGQIYIDMSSVSPQASARIADLVARAGASMLDAPVSGSVPQVETGTLAIMVGGDEQVFRTAEPLLRDLGQSVTHVGGHGRGSLLKLAVNISLAVQTLAFSEGLVLAEKGGIDPRLAAGVMSSSAIGSPMLRARVPLLLELPEETWFTIRLIRKDIALAIAEAQRAGVPLPSGAAAATVLDKALVRGYGQRDLAALHQVLRELSSARLQDSATGSAA